MAYIERNLARKVTLSDVATAVDLSTSRLAHLIREQSGQTPQQHLEGLRMQRATELLKRTGLSIKLIADSVGFDSQFYFLQRFKARTGQSPRDFRFSAKSRTDAGSPRYCSPEPWLWAMGRYSPNGICARIGQSPRLLLDCKQTIVGQAAGQSSAFTEAMAPHV